jgi:putative hydrolase of the HAD superfamily
MVIRAILLDIGGVLEWTPPTGWVARWETRLGLTAGGLQEKVSAVWMPGRTGGACFDDIRRRTAQVLGLDEEGDRELWEDVWAEYVGTPNEPLMAYLATLRPRYRTAILSNSFVGAREREQALYRFGDDFDPVIYSHEEGMEKPDPHFYRLACDRLALSPAEVVFVDDQEENVAGAQSIGMPAVLFRDNESAISQTRRLVDG